MSLVLTPPSMTTNPGGVFGVATQHEYSGKTKWSVSKQGTMIPTPSQNSASKGAGTNWTWDFITSIPAAIGYTVKNDANAVVGGLSSAAHATGSGMGSVYNGVASTASNVAGTVTSGLEGAAVGAYKQAGLGISSLSREVQSVASGAGGVVTGVINTAENAVSVLSFTPLILIGGIIALIFFFPQHAIKAGKVAAGAVAA